MIENGWIKSHRKLLDWEWYNDINTTRLFIHLLLTVSIKDDNWHGVHVPRGSRITSRTILAEETNLSERQVRTALDHLISTNEITKQTTRQCTIITVVNYDSYQSEQRSDRPATRPMERPTNDRQNDQRSDQQTDDQPTKQMINEATRRRPATRPTARPTNDRQNDQWSDQANNGQESLQSAACDGFEATERPTKRPTNAPTNDRQTDQQSDHSKEFIRLNFQEAEYKDGTGRKLPCYYMTRDGFTMLVMGYTGEKAMQFKEAYINRFNEMEEFIKTLTEMRQEFPLLTEQIKFMHENPKPYHFSNECDMINRLVLGISAKKFRELHGIPKGESIRPYLSAEEIRLMDRLQKIDLGLLIAFPEYEKRKQHLDAYLRKTKSIH